METARRRRSHDVLVVEEHDGIAFPLGRALRAHGYTVERVCTASDAAVSLAAGRVSLLVVDADLTDRDGIGFAKDALEHDITPAALLLTSVRWAPADGGFGAGSTVDHLIKPFALADFLRRANAMISSTAVELTGHPDGDDPAIQVSKHTR